MRTVPSTVRRFREVVREHGDLTALSWGIGATADAWTYAGLDRQVEDLTKGLLGAGVEAGSVIGLHADRRPQTVAAMLALWELGAAFVPISRDDPRDRSNFCLQLAGAAGVLELPTRTGAPLLIRDGLHAPRAPNQHHASPDEQVAYVMFTSGSTGTPKAVAVPHRAVFRLIADQAYLPFGSERTFLQAAPLSFDASVLELWGPLLNGGECALFPEHVPIEGRALSEFLEDKGVDTAWLTASLFHSITDADVTCLRPLRHLVIGGEQLSAKHVRRALQALPHTRLVNGYGPTENATFTTCYEIPRSFPEDAVRVPIGRPIRGSGVAIVNASLEPVAPGEPGELLATGAGLALEYLGAPSETAARFVQLSLPDGATIRAYRTGDRVVERADGDLEFLGRLDEQVKIDGFRIEPGECEATIARLPAVQQCKVVTRTDPAERLRLVAYLVCEENELDDVRGHVKASLPKHLCPDHWVVLTTLPLTRNGKIATDELPSPWNAGGAPATTRRTNALDHVLACWTAVLGAQPTDPTVGLFDAGGRSVDAMRLLTHLEQAAGQDLEPTFVFEFASAKQQATELSARGAWPTTTPVHTPRDLNKTR